MSNPDDYQAMAEGCFRRAQNRDGYLELASDMFQIFLRGS
jgi:hypothetical protein